MEKAYEKILRKYEKEEGNVISLLQDLEKEFGFVPEDAVYWFSHRLNIPASNFFGVATFYSQFHLKPRGRHIITACVGTACHVRGAEPIVNRMKEHLSLREDEDTTKDMYFTMDNVACMGACSLAPVIKIDKKVYGNVAPDEVGDILDESRGLKAR